MKKFESKEVTIDGFDVIELFSENQSAFIALDIGNTLYHWMWKDKSLIWFPTSLDTYVSSEKLAGNPLMYPWANRLSSDDFTFEGIHYPLLPDTLYRDGNGFPLHGLLLKTLRWKTKEIGSDDHAAWHVAEYHCELHGEIFAQFPFEHTLEMTHRLDENGIQVTLNVINQDAKNLPLSFGFHPYFSLEKYERSEVMLRVPYHHHVVTDRHLLPTGDLEPIENLMTNEEFPLDRLFLDDGFMNRIQGVYPYFRTADYQLEVIFDDEYDYCVMYAPLGDHKKYLCIEPMILSTNGLNRSVAGKTVPFVPPHSSRDFTFRMKVSDIEI